jgi:hypothetical protein
MRMLRRTTTAIVMLGAVVGLGILAVYEAKPTDTSPISAPAADVPPNVTSANDIHDSSGVINPPGNRLENGGVVFIDPETGEFTSTPPEDFKSQQDQDLQKALSMSNKNLKSEPLPGGGVMVYVGEGLENLTEATVDTNGQLRIRCVTVTPEPAKTAGESLKAKGTEE